jgi:hypothetical protein
MTQPTEEASTSGSSDAVVPAPSNAIIDQLRKLQLAGTKKAAKDKYQFWETQPVSQFTEDPSSTPVGAGAARRAISPDSRPAAASPPPPPRAQSEDGPIDPPKTVADVRQEPYNLPDGCASLAAGLAALHAPAQLLHALAQPVALAAARALAAVHAGSTGARWTCPRKGRSRRCASAAAQLQQPAGAEAVGRRWRRCAAGCRSRPIKKCADNTACRCGSCCTTTTWRMTTTCSGGTWQGLLRLRWGDAAPQPAMGQ